jgi:hypothetical protein
VTLATASAPQALLFHPQDRQDACVLPDLLGALGALGGSSDGAKRLQFMTTDFTDQRPAKSVQSVLPDTGACGAQIRL